MNNNFARFLLFIAVLASPALGRQRVSGICSAGAVTITATGSAVHLTPKTQGAYPSCIVNVYLAGTTTLATIYSDNNGTSLSNPFTANSSSGAWNFYADNGRYDVNQSGGGMPTPYTVGDVLVSDLTGPNAASQIQYTGAGTGTVPRPVSDRLDDVVSVKNFGAKGDGSTNDVAAFQAAADAIHAKGGGSVFIPYSPTCYEIFGLVIYYSNTTFYSDTQATCVQKQAGNNPGAVFTVTGLTQDSYSNIHFMNFTIDGNRDNITGIVSDGGNIAIVLENASNSTVENMLIKNNYTDGIYVDCNQAGTPNVGDNVSLINNFVTNSRRNNISLICGTHTSIIGGELSYAHGGSLSTGVDVEPNVNAQLVNGFMMSGVNVHHNTMGGILIQPRSDDAMQVSLVNNNVHDNGGAVFSLADGSGVIAVNFNVTGFANHGSFSLIGGSYRNNAGGAEVRISAFGNVSVSGATLEGVASTHNGALVLSGTSQTNLGPGFISLTRPDGMGPDIFGDNTTNILLAGVTLAHNTINAPAIPLTRSIITGPFSLAGANAVALHTTVAASVILPSVSNPLLTIQNTSSAGLTDVCLANDTGNCWDLHSLGSSYGRPGYLEMTYVPTNLIAFSLNTNGNLAVGPGNVADSGNSFDVWDRTASTGVTKVAIHSGAAQGSTPALTVPGTVSFGPIISGGFAGVTTTLTCGAGLHINSITIVGGIITATPTCN